MQKIIRITTVPISLGGLLQGQLKFMSQYFEVIGISSKDGTILKEVSEKEEVPVIAIEMTRKITPFKDLKSVYQLYKVFKKEKPDIVHSHTPKAGTVAMLAAKLAGVPLRLHTIAGLPLLEAKGAKRLLLDVVEKFTYYCATMIYPNSFVLKDIIIKNKYTTVKKLKVIAKGSSNGIDTSFFDPNIYSNEEQKTLKQQLAIKDTDFVFAFVGRLVTDKGINELVKAFKMVNAEFANAKLLLIGPYEKDLDPILPETEKEINSNPNIITTGWQKDVRPYFSIADVLTFPSYREGFPNVVMQAGAMGLPSIVTDINGCNEIIEHMVNGVIIPPKDTESLYEQMKRMVADKEMTIQLSQKSRHMIVDRYERQYVWEALLEEYRALIK